MTTLIDVFRSLEQHRGEFVIHDDGYRVRRFTYAQVTRAARGFAARLGTAGLVPGDKMLLWGENAAEWLGCYWGAVISGVIVVPIDYRSSPAFAARVAGIVAAKLVVAGDEVELDDSAAVFPAGAVWRFAEFDWNADGPLPGRPITREDVVQIVFTSGATAEPKGVVVRHKNLLANLVPVAKEVAKYKPYARPFLPLRFLNLLPLSHLFGQSMATNIPPLVDGTVVFMRSFNPHDIVRRVKEWHVSVIVCVPKILDVLREHVIRLDPAAADPPQGLSIPARWWRYRKVHGAFGYKYWAFVVGAAPLGPELEDFWKRLGFVVIQGYGLTETAPIVTLNHPFKTNTGSVGTPVGGVEVTIAEDGEILVRGENVTEGYFEPSRESAAVTRGDPAPVEGSGTGLRIRDAEGWLHTGDVGELDAQGRLFIRGRKKEMIVTPEGLNVFPDDVERVLETVPGVIESAVVGHRDATSPDERVHVVLVLEPGCSAGSVVERANSSLLDHQRIRGASVWTSGPLPRTEGTRKLKRAAIRAWVDTGGTAPVSRSQEGGLESVLAKFTAGRAVSGDATLEGLGLSSLERVELMVALEDKFQTRIDETKFAGARTLAELKTLLESAPAATAVDEPVDFPAVESQPDRWMDSTREPGYVDSAAGAGVRLGPGERPRKPGRPARASRVRGQSPEPPRRAGDSLGASWQVACPCRASHGQGVLQGALLPGRVFGPAGVHEPAELLPGRVLLQRLPAPATRSRRTPDAPLHRRGDRRRLLSLDLPGRGAVEQRRHQAVPRRHRDDRLAAPAAGSAGAPGRRRSRAASVVEDGAARPLFGDIRRAAPPAWRRLRGAGRPGGGSGPPFACSAGA